MQLTKLKSPDGKSEVSAHPSRVDAMLAYGWTVIEDDAEKAPAKKARARSKSADDNS